MTHSKRMISGLVFIAAALLVCPFGPECFAAGVETSGNGERSEDVSKLLQRGDALMEKAISNFEKGSVGDFARAAEIYEQAVRQQPDNYEANWKCARACRYYGEESRKHNVANWEDICADYGKKGMRYARKATEINSEKVHAYYYYGLCSGSYADGVGIITALREGLKDKTKNNLQTAYEIDPVFELGGPIVALGRFWQVVPWPYADKDKAMKYYREFQQTEFFDGSNSVQARIFMAEILMKEWGDEPKEEARQLLETVSGITEDPYWISRAQSLLEQL